MVNKLFRGLGITILGASLMFALAACADVPEGQTDTNPETTTEVTEDTTGPLKIGGILPLTGDGAAYGNPMQKVAEIALAKVNADGIANGRTVEFIWEDGKCNGADAANAARKLIEVDKVEVIYGGFCSSETLAIAPVAEKAGVTVLSTGSSSPDITTAGDYIFRNYPSDATQGQVLAEEANRRGYKKIAILSEQNDYTLGVQGVFENKFNGEVEVQTFLPNDSDFRTPLLKLKSGEPDALFINPQTPAKADLAFKQLEEMDWNVALIGNDAVAGFQDLISKYSEALEDMLVAEFAFDRNNPEFVALEDKFKENTGEDLPYGTYASTSYDAVFILAEAMASAGNNSDGVRDYLYAINGRKGLGGTLIMDENGDPKAGHRLEVVKDGKVVVYEVPEAPKGSSPEGKKAMDEEGEAVEAMEETVQ